MRRASNTTTLHYHTCPECGEKTFCIFDKCRNKIVQPCYNHATETERAERRFPEIGPQRTMFSKD